MIAKPDIRPTTKVTDNVDSLSSGTETEQLSASSPVCSYEPSRSTLKQANLLNFNQILKKNFLKVSLLNFSVV